MDTLPVLSALGKRLLFWQNWVMPLYTYVCKRGHETEALVKLDESNAPHSCPYITNNEPCSYPLTKQMSVTAKSFPGADSWRK